MKKLLVVAAGLDVLAAAGLGLTQSADAAAEPVYHPTRLAHVGDARQLVVVTGASKTSTYATLRTYRKNADGTWTEQFAAMPARTGYGGWVAAAKRVQNTGTTPQGTFRITTAFGLRADPGTRLPYQVADSGDYWVGDQQDPRTYNLFQPAASANRTWRTGQAEKLASYPTQYEHVAVIDFNRPKPANVVWHSYHAEFVTTAAVNVKLGSAIFLHVNGAGSTAGCVSVPRSHATNRFVAFEGIDKAPEEALRGITKCQNRPGSPTRAGFVRSGSSACPQLSGLALPSWMKHGLVGSSERCASATSSVM